MLASAGPVINISISSGKVKVMVLTCGDWRRLAGKKFSWYSAIYVILTVK